MATVVNNLQLFAVLFFHTHLRVDNNDRVKSMYFHSKFTSSSLYNDKRKHKKREPMTTSSGNFKNNRIYRVVRILRSMGQISPSTFLLLKLAILRGDVLGLVRANFKHFKGKVILI